jgi:ectoine hydroxylase-related dioxygenase (phytanoyl-CoA dioxygenase family)
MSLTSSDTGRVEVDVDAYRRDGWLHLPAFLTPEELSAWRLEADRLLARPELFRLEGRGELLKGTTRTDRLDPVLDMSPVFAAAAEHPGITAAAEAVLGGPLQLFKDKFIAKPSGAPGYGAHQDLPYWPSFDFDGDRVLTAFAFLDDADAENGALECVPGQHGSWLTEHGVVADPDECRLGTFRTLHCRAGDVLLLHALTPHRSGANRSSRMRRTLLFTYTSDPTPGLYERYQAGRPHRGGRR